MDLGPGAPRLVLVGYSKGTPDVLEAIVTYPEIRPRVAAVVSVAGAVGGSPLANDAEQYQADLMRHFPGATCDSGDGGGVASLRTDVRRTWLAQQPAAARRADLLGRDLAAARAHLVDPAQERRQAAHDRRPQRQPGDLLRPGHSRARRLVGYLNADHWAIAVPIARAHDTIGSLFVTQNAYPREALHGSGAAFRRRRPCRARASRRSAHDRSRLDPPLLAALASPASARPGGRPGPRVGLSRTPRHRGAGRRASSTPSAGRCSTASGARPARATNSGCASRRADGKQGVAPACIDWAAFAGDRRRPLVLEQEHARQRPGDRAGSCRSPTWRRS